MKIKDKDTRYFLDINTKTQQITHLSFGNRLELEQHLTYPLHRVFVTLGQYNKLLEKWD